MARGILVATAALGLVAVGGVAEASTPATSEFEPVVLDTVIVVDESGSLSETDLALEREAATLIALGGLNPRSRVTVIGFGSDNGGQSAVDVVCRPTLIDNAANRKYLSSCTSALRVRAADEGNDTDHAAAMAQALSFFDGTSSDGAPAPSGALRTVFILTDGNLDVRNSPRYALPDRNANALAVLRQQLNRAQDLQAQVWPLGFGSSIDNAMLTELAVGASASQCGNPPSPPTARVVRSSADVSRSLLSSFSYRTCTGSSGPTSVSIPGQTTVLVPEIATDGAIIVAKGDPRVEVTYLDPDGRVVPSDGPLGSSSFSRSGQDQSVESLRISDPLPGDWTVRVSAPAGVPAQRVNVVALWQGAVRAALYTEPAVAQPDESVTIRVSVLTRAGAVNNAAALRGIQVKVTALVDGAAAGTEPVTVAVRDDGVTPDDKSGDGVFSGTITAPGTIGSSVGLTATVLGPSVYSNPLRVTLPVVASGTRVVADLALDVPRHVIYGDRATGTVTWSNGTSEAVPARLSLTPVTATGTGTDAGAIRLLAPPELVLAPGTGTQSFMVEFAPQPEAGARSARLSVIVADHPDTPLGAMELRFSSAPAPPWWRVHLWALVGTALAALAALAWLLRRRQAQRRAADVSGLMVELLDPVGRQIGSPLHAPGRLAVILKFALLGAGAAAPGRTRLVLGDGDGDGIGFELRRPRPGQASLREDGGSVTTVTIGDPSSVIEVTEQLFLRVREKRRTGQAWAEPAPERDGEGTAYHLDQADLWGEAVLDVGGGGDFDRHSRPTVRLLEEPSGTPAGPRSRATADEPAGRGHSQSHPGAFEPTSPITPVEDDPWM